jgi:hypothetical protein
LLKGEQVGALFPHQRRLAALQALVERLMAAHELEEAVSAARLATALAPCNFINTVNPFLKGELFLAIADRLLAQGNATRAGQLLDEAWLLVDLIDPDEQGQAWVSLAPRYLQAGRRSVPTRCGTRPSPGRSALKPAWLSQSLTFSNCRGQPDVEQFQRKGAKEQRRKVSSFFLCALASWRLCVNL